MHGESSSEWAIVINSVTCALEQYDKAPGANSGMAFAGGSIIRAARYFLASCDFWVADSFLANHGGLGINDIEGAGISVHEWQDMEIEEEQ